MTRLSPLASLMLAMLAASALTAPAFAGDAAKGESDFKKCKSCHSIVADDGTVIVKGAKVGPNLYGVIGRKVGSYPDFKYDEYTAALGEKGLVWDEAMLAAYVADPTAWLKEQSGDAGARSAMTFKLAKGGEDVAAYLATQKPAP